jgi:hypothetical protein
LIRIAAIIVPLLVVVSLGFVYERTRRTDMTIANVHNLEVFMPATVFVALSDKSFDISRFLGLLGMGAVLILACGVVAWGIARLIGVAAKTLAPPMMFTNCGNLGLPLAVLTFGPQALAPAIALFVLSNLLQFTLGLYMLDHHAKLWGIARMPVVIATFAGLLVGICGIEIWSPLLVGIRMLGDISVPLMLFAVGVRLAQANFHSWRIGLFGAALRPTLGVALAAGLSLLFPLPNEQRSMLLVFGALPPGILNFVLAERYAQEPEKVAAIVMLGNGAALLTIPCALAFVT